MPKTLLELRNRPLLDIVSHGRSGRRGDIRLSPDQIAAIDRTVRRVPEVMVKVLPKDSNSLRSVSRHLNYIGRYGKLELETDDGERMQGKEAGKTLLENWDLDLDKHRKEVRLASVLGRAPKLVHKVMLSMPPGTPAKGVLDAVRNFAREEFALKHRYALVLHTDEPHPHVHLVVKAVSERGVRLHTTPATLREWRCEFARHLREQGIAANATGRAVRGQTRKSLKDGIYRASLRGESTHLLALAESATRAPAAGGKPSLIETHVAVKGAWTAVAKLLARDGRHDAAREVRRFTDQMPAPKTDREWIGNESEIRAPDGRGKELTR
jgi:hypothetical protein